MSKTLNNEGDDRWRNKGHAHTDKNWVPEVCPTCKGMGYIRIPAKKHWDLCRTCYGTGEV